MKKLIAFVLSVVMLLSTIILTANSKSVLPFTDVKENNWFYESVKYCYENELMNGLSENTFGPSGKMTRAMFVTMLARLSGGELKDAKTFSDVKASNWFSKYVGWAETTGVVKGYSDGTFKPDNPISRQEAAVAIMRYIEYKGAIMPTDKTAPVSFTDNESIAGWSKDYVNELRRYGLIKGDSNLNFNPKGNLSRAESATILMRMHQVYCDITMEEPVSYDCYNSSLDAYVMGAERIYYSGTALTSSYSAFELKDNTLYGSDTGRKYTQFYNSLPNKYAADKTGNYFSFDANIVNVPTNTYKYAVIGVSGGTVKNVGIDASTFKGDTVFSEKDGKIIADLTTTPGYNSSSDEIKITLISDDNIGIRYIIFFSSQDKANSFSYADNKSLVDAYDGYDIFYEEMDENTLNGYMTQFESRKEEIINADDIDPKTISGNCWYISSENGNDSNDGRTPNTAFKTVKGLYTEKIKGVLYVPKPKAGDAVFFERGCIYYPSYETTKSGDYNFTAIDGVTYSAYGNGELPIITTQVKFDDGSATGTWTLVDGTDDVYALTQKITRPEGTSIDYNDIGNITFNDGELYGVKVYTSNYENPIGTKTNSNYGWTTNGKDCYYESSITLEGPQSLVNNLEFWFDCTADTLYLCSKDGNPGEIFNEIHIAKRGNGLSVANCSDITISNIAFKWIGFHGIDVSNATDFKVENCVFEWIGGAVDGARLGNAVQNWGNCDGFYVDNNYINQVYDTGITTQGGNGKMVNISFSGNAIERCNMNIEIFNGVNDDDTLDCLVNVKIADNIERYAGYSFGHQRGIGNKTGTFYLGSKGNDVFVSNFIVENNICLYAAYFTAAESYVSCGEKSEGEIFRNNIYLMSPERGYCFRARHSIENRYTKNGTDYSKTLLPYTVQYIQYLADMGVERGTKFYTYSGYIFPEESIGVYRDN